MAKRLFIFCFISLFTVPSLAETVYVTDMLKLNVHEEPQSKGKTLATLSSGDPIVIIERLPGYAKIRTNTGVVGWTKSAYLVSDKPPRLIVNELQEKLALLQEQAMQATEKAKTANLNAEKYQQLLQSTEQSSKQQGEELKKIQLENQEYESSMDQYESSVPMNIFLIACGLLFIIGILLGWYIIDYRQRMRHGGFRI